MIRVDAHQHFWQPLRGDYDWMPADNETLARPYDPSAYLAVAEAAGLTVHLVQGKAENIKVTTEDDLAMAESWAP